MTFARWTWSLALVAAAAGHAFAQTSSNPNATLSLLVDSTYRLGLGETLDTPLAVRVVDSSGAPLPGIVVDIFPDICGSLPLFHDVCPPQEIYGHFADPAFLSATTDENGVATAPAFTAGDVVGRYDIAFGVFTLGHPENAVVGSPALLVYVHVEQVALDDAVPIDAAFTGTWYDPSQSGHGLFLEVLPEQRLVAYWFTFTPTGEPAWFGGVGAIDGDVATVSVDTVTGGAWIPNFDPAQVRLRPWGTLTFQFSDCHHGRVDFTSAGAGYGHMDLTRLTQPVGIACP